MVIGPSGFTNKIESGVEGMRSWGGGEGQGERSSDVVFRVER